MAINILHAFNNKPQELDFLWSGFLLGTVGALVAPGATGKSFWALEAAMAVACEVPGGNLLGLKTQKTGRVVYYAGEDPALAIIQRIHAIGKQLTPEARHSISQNLAVEDTMGQMLNICNPDQQHNIMQYCMGARLIVFDTLSRIHTLDENNNGDMAYIVSLLEFIAKNTGASVLFLHHVSKGSARDGQIDQQQAARGASSLIDNARWCGFVSKMTKEEAKELSESEDEGSISEDRRHYFVRFGVSKQNYVMPESDCWYKRTDGGVLLPVSLSKTSKNCKGTYRAKE